MLNFNLVPKKNKWIRIYIWKLQPPQKSRIVLHLIMLVCFFYAARLTSLTMVHYWGQKPNHRITDSHKRAFRASQSASTPKDSLNAAWCRTDLNTGVRFSNKIGLLFNHVASRFCPVIADSGISNYITNCIRPMWTAFSDLCTLSTVQFSL